MRTPLLALLVTAIPATAEAEFQGCYVLAGESECAPAEAWAGCTGRGPAGDMPMHGEVVSAFCRELSHLQLLYHRQLEARIRETSAAGHLEGILRKQIRRLKKQARALRRGVTPRGTPTW